MAIAATRTAALLVALDVAARLASVPGEPAAPARAGRDSAPPWAAVALPAGGEAAAVAPLPIALLARLAALESPPRSGAAGTRRRPRTAAPGAEVPLALWRRWGLTTLGALAALPAADVFERLGAAGLSWHAMARGVDARPLVPTVEVQPFEATCAFEWPIEAIEPLAFALGRVIDPLCARLDHDGLGTVTLQTTLRLVTRDLYVRRLGLPMPMRDPRVLRTLIVLDLESHPPPAGIDAVTVTFEPVPGRILQPSLLARAHPRPEAIATLTARLRAVMGDGRVGSPVVLDTHRGGRDRDAAVRRPGAAAAASPSPSAEATATGRPVRRGSRCAGSGRRRRCASSSSAAGRFASGPSSHAGCRGSARCGRRPVPGDRPATGGASNRRRWAMRRPAAPPRAVAHASVWQPDPSVWSDEPATAWDDDEWDVVLESGCALRLARDRGHDAWVVAALID